MSRRSIAETQVDPNCRVSKAFTNLLERSLLPAVLNLRQEGAFTFWKR